MTDAPLPGCWYVYMVLCSDNSLYTGITTDLERRMAQHNDGIRGARYTRTRRPVRLVYVEAADNRSLATRREIQIKQMPVSEKKILITAGCLPAPPTKAV